MSFSSDSALARWSVPECPFAIAYEPRVLDDIRLAVVDAYFSLPRGGAEIGGILLGRRTESGLLITDSAQLECEHAFGPGFTLSANDQSRLAAMLDAARQNPEAQPVGWYHSHTRSEIFLSEADLEIHQRFFPEPWQVALVLKPHTFQPVRAGFFFTAADGRMRTDASHREFQLEPLDVRPLPSRQSEGPAAAPPPSPAPAAASPPPEPAGTVIDIIPAAMAEPAIVAEPAPPPPPKQAELEAAPAEIPSPTFLRTAPLTRTRRPLWAFAAAAALGCGMAFTAYATRGWWMAQVAAAFAPPSPMAHAALGLSASEQSGKIELRWNPAAPGIARATGGILLISDGPVPKSVPLDAMRLKAGVWTYAPATDRVEVTLSVGQPNGQRLVESASFAAVPAAAPPTKASAEPSEGEPSGAGERTAPAKPTPDNARLRAELEELRDENARLKATLARQADSIKRLEKYIEDDRKEHQTKRLMNQAPDGKFR